MPGAIASISTVQKQHQQLNSSTGQKSIDLLLYQAHIKCSDRFQDAIENDGDWSAKRTLPALVVTGVHLLAGLNATH